MSVSSASSRVRIACRYGFDSLMVKPFAIASGSSGFQGINTDVTGSKSAL
jgi:predicted alpha/beta hydrolase